MQCIHNMYIYIYIEIYSSIQEMVFGVAQIGDTHGFEWHMDAW